MRRIRSGHRESQEIGLKGSGSGLREMGSVFSGGWGLNSAWRWGASMGALNSAVRSVYTSQGFYS